MPIIEIKENKKQYLDLLLLADEQEDMIDRYLERGTMYALCDDGVKAVCVVTDEGGGVLEIKNHMEKEDIFRMCREIEAEEYLQNVIFISFDFENLVFVREYSPEQTVQFLFVDFTEEIFENVLRHRFDIDIHYPKLTKEMLDRCHANGVEVNCWTVNEAVDGERLAEWGIDYITSNILE